MPMDLDILVAMDCICDLKFSIINYSLSKKWANRELKYIFFTYIAMFKMV